MKQLSSSCAHCVLGSSPQSVIALSSLSGESASGPLVSIGMLLLRLLALEVACVFAATRVAQSAAVQTVVF